MDGLGLSYLSYPINLTVRRKDDGQYVYHSYSTESSLCWWAGGNYTRPGQAPRPVSVSIELNDDRKMKSAKKSLQDQSSSLFL